MKIKSIEIIQPRVLESARMRIVWVRVNSDEGFYGLGEIGVAIVSGATGAVELIRDFAPRLIGLDPFDTEVIWDMLHRTTFWAIGNGAIIFSAISALDTALWDLKARALGLPLYKLLGGKQREGLRAYASQLQFGWGVDQQTVQKTPEEFAEMAIRAKEDGFEAIKLNVIRYDEEGRSLTAKDVCGFPDKKLLKMADARLRAVRDAVGPDMDIILENHANTDTVSAVTFANIAKPYGILFMEEAASPMNADAFRLIADRSGIPQATGERTYTRWGFKDLLQGGGLALIQPDIGNCGGVSEFMKISQMAEIYDVGVQAHVCSSPVSVAVSLQLEAVLPNFSLHEHHMVNTTSEVTRLGTNDYQPVNGVFSIPEEPGIGMDLSEEALKESTFITIQ